MALMILPDEPEKRLIYSLSHDVAVAIVEIVGGERYEDYLTCRMVCPLGLSQMMMYVLREAEDRRAAQYMCDFQTGKVSLTTMENRFRLTPNYDSGGADNYCAVLDALCNGGIGANGQRILKEASVAACGKAAGGLQGLR